MKRRHFLGISAATVVVAAITVWDWDAIGAEARPNIGSTFYFQDWLYADSMDDALWKCRHYGLWTMRRVEEFKGIIFGAHRREVKWHHDKRAWSVLTQATVVGYA